MRRIAGAVLLIVFLAVAAWAWFDLLGAQAKEPPRPQFETFTVSRGDLVATVSATGVLEPEKQVALTFGTTGRVVEVLVEEGDTVRAGDLLARLEDTDLRLQVRQAEANLAAAEAQLAQLRQGPDPAEIDAAKAALAAAQAAYQDLVAGPDPDEIASAKAAVERARVRLDQAQAAYDQVKHLPNVGMLPQSQNLQLATIEYEQAQAQLRLVQKPPKESQVAQALASIAQAQANLDRLLRGPDPNQLAAQEALVEEARISLEQARRALDRTELRAPIEGVVTSLNLEVGQMAPTTQPVVVITVLRPLHTTVQVDELDVGQVREGQVARITVDALPDLVLTGVLTYLSPTPTVQGGIVTYKARVELQENDPDLRPGMNVSVEIITAQAEDVILIPNRVMRVDRQTGEFYVEKLVDGIPVRTPVKVGLRNDQFSEITQGLEPGDVIVIREVSARERLRQGFFGQ